MARRTRSEGSIYRREDGLWVGQIYIAGKKHVKHSKVQKEVRDWLHKQKEAVKNNSYIINKAYTVSALFTRYIKDIASHKLAPRTLSSYRNLANNHILPALGPLKLTELRVDHIQKFYSDELNKGFSRATVRTIHEVLHIVLAYGVKWGVVMRNVADLAEQPPPNDQPATILNVEQANQLLDLVKGTRYYALFLCALSLGLREGELLGLTWDCIHWEKRTLRIEKQLQYIPTKGLQLKSPKTKSSYRTLPLPEITYNALQEHWIAYQNGVFVFCTSKGTPPPTAPGT